jgi:hypothetical protein
MTPAIPHIPRLLETLLTLPERIVDCKRCRVANLHSFIPKGAGSHTLVRSAGQRLRYDAEVYGKVGEPS